MLWQVRTCQFWLVRTKPKNQVWFLELEHDFFKRTRFPILLKCGSLEPENKLEVCQKQAFVCDFCGKVQQLLRVRMHSLNQFCLWEPMLVWLGLGETHETHVPIMLYEIFFSYAVCSYWLLKSFFFIIFLHFWFLNFWFFFRGKKSTNLWVIRFNFCLKKRCYVFFSMASNLVVDNATHHKKKSQHATRKTCTRMFLSCICACWKNWDWKNGIDFHSNFNRLGRQP